MIVLKPDPKVVNSYEQRSREDGVRRAAADPSRPGPGGRAGEVKWCSPAICLAHLCWASLTSKNNNIVTLLRLATASVEAEREDCE